MWPERSSERELSGVQEAGWITFTHEGFAERRGRRDKARIKGLGRAAGGKSGKGKGGGEKGKMHKVSEETTLEAGKKSSGQRMLGTANVAVLMPLLMSC